MGCTVLDEVVFSRLVGSIERGEIKPLLVRACPLESVSQVQVFLLEMQFIGEFVIDMAL